MITRTPGIVGGRPRITGTRISVRNIVILYQQGLTPEEISLNYPHLTLAQVYAALAYYHANREALDEAFATEEAEAARLEQEWLATRRSP